MERKRTLILHQKVRDYYEKVTGHKTDKIKKTADKFLMTTRWVYKILEKMEEKKTVTE